MKLDSIHHIAIIGHDYARTREFYVDKLGFDMLDEHHRPDKQDILFNVRKGNLTLEIFITEEAPKRPASRDSWIKVRESDGLCFSTEEWLIRYAYEKPIDYDRWVVFHIYKKRAMTMARYIKKVKIKPARQKNLKNLR